MSHSVNYCVIKKFNASVKFAILKKKVGMGHIEFTLLEIQALSSIQIFES